VFEKLLILFSCLIFNSICVAGINFSFGEKVRVLSDKGYRFTTENKFIAEGNVIIVSDENTLYGNKAQIYLNDQRFIIEEDVKLVNPDFSLLGESFQFSSANDKLELLRAIIITDNYKVVGEKVSRVGKGDIVLKNASYTTCKDCPNSWSFKGETIFITPGKYVRIKGAYFVISGVNVLYLPFFFFPIKKSRESGVLFPRLSVNLNDGTFLQVPYFQTFGDSADMTITPTLWGRWGVGGEFEFRKAFHGRNMLQLESKFVRRYDEDKSNIHVSSLDFSFWSRDDRLKLFSVIDYTNSYDSLRRFERYIDQSYARSDFGGELRMGYTGASLEASLNASSRANLITPSNKGIDSDYVQTLPEIKFDFVSSNILDVKYLPVLDGEVSFNFSQFRQRELRQENYSRNSDRFILNGSLNAYYNNIFPIGNVRSRHIYRHSIYDLRFTDGRDDYQKREVFHFFNWEVPLKKKYGKAEFIKTINEDSLGDNGENNLYVSNSSSSLVLNKKSDMSLNFNTRSSFIHQMNLNLNFYHLGNVLVNSSGRISDQFFSNDFSPNSAGIFDYKDSIMTFENGIQANSTLSSLQRTNTIEFLITNNVYENRPVEDAHLSEGELVKINTNHIGSFRVSQGAILKNKFVPQTTLSRLLLGANTNVKGIKIDFSDSYFHDSQEHLLNLSIAKSFSLVDFSSELIYDSRTVPYNKILNSKLGVFINPEIKVSYRFSYDISVDSFNFEDYVVRYLPRNDCWFLEFNYFTDRIQSRYSFNFMLNLNEKQFKNYAKL
jgi:LPS-assembly protein